MRIILFLALAAALAPQDAAKDSAWYPLKVGTKWSYRLGEHKIVVTVTKHEKVGDVTCALLETTVDGKVAGTEHIGAKDDGVYRFTFNGLKGDPPLRFLKLPPKKGDTWEVASVIGGDEVKGQCKAEEEEIDVPAGKHKTIAVTIDFSVGARKSTMKTWYAEGVGIVKIRNGESEIELEKHEPAK